VRPWGSTRLFKKVCYLLSDFLSLIGMLRLSTMLIFLISASKEEERTAGCSDIREETSLHKAQSSSDRLIGKQSRRSEGALGICGLKCLRDL
jgi:hypothetical protein